MKTSELIGPQLDWAVMRCEHLTNSVEFFNRRRANVGAFMYSTDWAQGGPIIEREAIELAFAGREWRAQGYNFPGAAYGPTLLIAAMRCFVASKLGGDVDIPAELL